MDNSKIKKYRSFIMGIAIIWIAIYHIPLKTSIPVLHFINDTGYGGVDFFVFVAGFGMYYSLAKSDSNGLIDLHSYIKRKMLRFLPSYLPFIFVWMIVKKILHRIYMTEVFGNLTMTGWWNGAENQFNWYIDLMLLLYIIGPLIYAIIVNTTHVLRNAVLVLLLMFMMGVSFFHGQLILAISRLPIFVLGMLMAVITENGMDTEAEEKLCKLIECRWIWYILSVIGIAILYVCRIQTRLDCWHYGLYWYPFFLIVPGVSVLFTDIADVFSGRKATMAIVNFISEIGKASLEIFLFHLAIFEFMQLKGTYTLGIWIIAYVIAFVTGYGYYRIVNNFVRRWK